MRRGMLWREVAPGGRTPLGWRMAWFDPMRHVAVYMPIPLHWLARVAREFEWRARMALMLPGRDRQTVIEAQQEFQVRQRLSNECSRGFLQGWRECFDACADAWGDEGPFRQN
jgi:hypothetical protein